MIELTRLNGHALAVNCDLIRYAESSPDTTLTLVDIEIKKHELKKTDIQEQRPLTLSTMPDGVEKRLTEQEFVDLAYARLDPRISS